MPNSIVLNGVKTRGVCPGCLEENMIEHGCDERGLIPLHLTHCPTCGDSIAIVAFHCPNCKRKETYGRGKRARLHSPGGHSR
jgi:hypothetical protein